MTEVDWLTCQQPHQMRDYLMRYDAESGTVASERMGYRTSERKLRLVAAAMLRSVWGSLVDPTSRPAVERLERIADGYESPVIGDVTFDDHIGIFGDAVFWTLNNASVYSLNLGTDRPYQADLFREIVGNPFRPFVTEKQYLTNAKARAMVTAVAHETWQSRRYKDRGDDRGDDKTYDRAVEALVIRQHWLTPTVVALAHAANDNRPGREAPCAECGGGGELVVDLRTRPEKCQDCAGTGINRVEDGTLDPGRLAVLSDALEDVGCPTHHDRYDCPACSARGWFWTAKGSEPAWKEECADCDGTGLITPPNRLLAHLRSPGPHFRGCWAVDLILERE